MRKAFGTKIGQRVLLVFFPLALIPLLGIGWTATFIAKRAIHRQTLSSLQAASDGAEAELREFIADVKDRTVSFSLDGLIRDSVESLRDHPSNAVGSARMVLQTSLEQKREAFPDSEELFVLDLQGRVLSSTASGAIGKSRSEADFFQAGQKGVFVSDIFSDAFTGKPTWMFAAPITSRSTKQIIGVLVNRMNPKDLSDLMAGRRMLRLGALTQSFRIGDTGESYIVNRQKLMITESRFIDGAMLRERVETLPVQVGLAQHREMTGDYISYRGHKVSGASMLLQEPGWIVITEIDFSEAFAPLRRFEWALLPLALAAMVPVGLLGWRFTREIVDPLQRLRNAETRFMESSTSLEEVLVPENAIPRDEIGDAIRKRNQRVTILTEQKRELTTRTKALEETVQSLEELCYHLVHDLRAPLRAMQSFSELLLSPDAGSLTAQGREYALRITDSARKADALMNDLLEFGKIGHMPMPTEKVDLRAVVSSALDDLHDRIAGSRAQIHLPDAFPPVLANLPALKRVVRELLNNALKFVAPGVTPVITIDSAKTGDAVRIRISDNGIGIPAEYQLRVFDIFERLHSDVTYGGTGIGLAIVAKAISRMSGRFGVVSRPGEGSTFWFELPAGGTVSNR